VGDGAAASQNVHIIWTFLVFVNINYLTIGFYFATLSKWCDFICKSDEHSYNNYFMHVINR